MKSCISFVGLLAVGNCKHISKSNTRNNIHNNFRQRNSPTSQFYPDQGDYQDRGRNSYSNHPAIQIRGGSLSSTTQIKLSASTTMASLFAGSVGGAIGVGISYPFDTLSTKAQVNTGKNETQLNFVQSMESIWKNEGVRGFFEGVLVTVRFHLVCDALSMMMFQLFSSMILSRSNHFLSFSHTNVDDWSGIHQSHPIRCQ